MPANKPKKGAMIELKGLIAQPELNGCTGVIISNYDDETGRCGVKLDDGTGVNAKLANIVVLSPEEAKLKRALVELKEAGGTEDDEPEDDDEDYKDPAEYLDELAAVADARHNLGQYEEAGNLYYTSYHIAKLKRGILNDPLSFPYAHKMLESWSKSDSELVLKKAHGMANQTLMMPGCPRIIRQDLETIESSLRHKGFDIPEDPMTTLRKNMANVGM